MAFATSSLPVPEAPRIRTVASEEATKRICSAISRISLHCPTIPSGSLIRRRSFRFSSSRAALSSFSLSRRKAASAATFPTVSRNAASCSRSGSEPMFSPRPLFMLRSALKVPMTASLWKRGTQMNATASEACRERVRLRKRLSFLTSGMI